MTNEYSFPADEILFQATCKEGDRKVVRSVRPMVLNGEDIVRLWFKLSKFPILFASPQETNFRNFVRILQDPYTVLLEVDDIGMFMISDLTPGVEAKIHISFWDSRLSGREPLLRELTKWVLDVLHVRRVSAPIRADARAMRAFMDRVGFYFEGALKNWVQRETKYFDLHLYGVTREEVDVHWMNGRSWAKPRVRLLEVYETK